MYALRLTASRVRVPAARMAAHDFSSEGITAAEKLSTILEEYRRKNYTQTVPMRFKKDLVVAAVDKQTNKISVDDMRRVLHNIGADDRIHKDEIKLIWEELGYKDGIPAEDAIRLF